MTRRDLNNQPHGHTAVSVVCVVLVLLFGGLEEGGLRLGGHAAVTAQFGGVLGSPWSRIERVVPGVSSIR